ncbi:putative manganese transporter [Verrucomicrobiota bacterium]
MIVEVLKHTLMITSFVFVMMLVIEYFNVLSKGKWENKISRYKWGQSIFTSLLGVTPGCLGSYAAVSLYTHKVITFGALTAAMLATSGDEAFVMLSLFPRQALIIFAVLLVVGIVSGIAVDFIFKDRRTQQDKHLSAYQSVHGEEERCICFSWRELIDQWKHCSAHRGWLTFFLTLFIVGIVSGEIGHHDMDFGAEVTHHCGWNWVRITLLVAGCIGLFIVSTVPDHFLEEHLWKHLAKVHVWRIFVWTFGALLLMHILIDHMDLEPLIEESHLVVLLIACLVGLIPQSGPHLIFVTLYAQGMIPLSVLLANCIVQNGHGMLPVLAHSRRAFVAVKVVGFVIGGCIGLAGYLMGW